nr:MAG: nsp1a [Astroviridae sp.]
MVTPGELIGEYFAPITRMLKLLLTTYSEVQRFNLDQLVIVAIALCFSRSVKRAWLGLVIHAICYITGSKMFPLLLAIHYLPTLAMPFMAATMLFPQVYSMLIAVVLIITLTVDALMSGELTLMQRLSGVLLSTAVFVAWQIADMTLKVLALPLGMQVVITVVAALANVGFSAATGTVTITNPDGTTTKYKRYTQIGNTIAEKVVSIWQKAKAVRGVLPSFPLQTDAVCLVEVETQDGLYQGTGFRLGNYIYTAGHVVKGATKINLKWNGLSVQGKLVGEIELPMFTDTMARIQVPNAFTLMKSLRVAKELQNDYFQMISFGQNHEPVTFTGWGTIDSPYFAAPFATHPGTSGSPVIDRTGKVVAMHFGSNLACSSGYVLTDLFRTEPPVKQCTVQDELMEKVVQGVRNATSDIMAKIEQMLLRLNAVEKSVTEKENKITNLCKVIDKNADEYNKTIPKLHERLCKLEELIKTQEVQEVTREEAKGKTKKTVRGAKARYAPIAAAIKKKFSKMKMLTEEEYKRLQDEGFTAAEIREVVNNLREQAFLNWQMENEDDWESEPEWSDYDHDFDSDREIVETQKARLKVHVEKEDKVKSLEIKYPDGAEEEARRDLKEILTEEPVPENETHVVLYYDDEGAIYVDDKKVTFKKVKLEGHTQITKNKETVISGTPQQPKIQKISTTTKVEKPKEEQEEQIKDQESREPVEEQKKRAWKQKRTRNDDTEMCTCNVCGEQFSLKKAYRHKCPKNSKRAPSGAQ